MIYQYFIVTLLHPFIQLKRPLSELYNKLNLFVEPKSMDTFAMDLIYLNYRMNLIQSKDVYNITGPYQAYVDKLYNLSYLDERYEDFLEELLVLLSKYVRKENRKKNNKETSLELEHFINIIKALLHF